MTRSHDAPGPTRSVPVRSAAALLAALLCVLQLALAGPSAALPKGAYWYTVLDLAKAWTVTKGAGVTVAVIDSGVQADLGDLRGQVLPGLDLSATHRGAHHDVPEKGTRQFGHGTGMAALIAGTGRGGGMVGVAPQAKILPVNVDDAAGNAPITSEARGIEWAVDHGAKVINISLGGRNACTSIEGAAVAYAYRHDVIVVASAGDGTSTVDSPANCPGAIAVGGVDAQFKPWTKTPSGPEISFVAPAFDLVNEELDGTLGGPNPLNAGTSQAAAIVSGTFALLRAKFPHESARQIVARALHHVHNGLGVANLGKHIDDTLGYGEILPYFALTEATPAGAANPIYDRFDQQLKSSGATSSPSSPAASSAAPSTPPSSAAPSSGRASSSSGSSGPPIPLIITIVVVVLLVAGLIVLVARRRRPRPTGAPGWPPA